MTVLVAPLFDGPIDIIGDVHGEIGALQRLLGKLEYDSSGEHRSGRRLVFVGDLCDRGPESFEVIKLVARLCASGLAQCVLGNHELNILRAHRTAGSDWWFAGSGMPAPEDQHRTFVLEFLSSLPVALTSDRLRVVHACWSDWAVSACKAFQGPAHEAHAFWSMRIEQELAASGLTAGAEEELAHFGERLRDPARPPPLLKKVASRDVQFQCCNPIRVLTSGLEKIASEPRFMLERWRMVQREAWWRTYSESTPVIFGHYWRTLNPGLRPHLDDLSFSPQWLDEECSSSWLGPRKSAFCIDYSAGLRNHERSSPVDAAKVSRLAAIRWPESELLFDI